MSDRTFGCELQVDRGSGYETIASVRTTGAPAPKVEIAEATVHDSNGGGMEYQETGRIEPGSIAFEILHKSANSLHTALIVATVSPPNPRWSWRMWIPSGEGWQFAAILESYASSPKQGEPLLYAGSLKLTGLPTRVTRTPS